jgi:hypothetical protein
LPIPFIISTHISCSSLQAPPPRIPTTFFSVPFHLLPYTPSPQHDSLPCSLF